MYEVFHPLFYCLDLTGYIDQAKIVQCRSVAWWSVVCHVVIGP